MLISVIVPIYKVEKYINRCVDSVIAQSLSDFELTLVDDGSTDSCGCICDEYANMDSCITVIHKINGGLSDARNLGIDLSFTCSNSSWITFIDSDDWINPRYLEALYHATLETECQISVCGYRETTIDLQNPENISLKSEAINTEKFFCENNVNAVVAWGKLYKKELFKNIRYPIGKLHEDEFTTYKVLFLNEQIVFVNASLYNYYCNMDSITKTNWNPNRIDGIIAMEECLNFLKKYQYRDAYLFYLKKMICFVVEVYIKHKDELVNRKHIVRLLKHILRKLLRLSRIEGQGCFSENKYLYEVAYPRLMNYYWLFQSFKSKITGR